MAYSPLTDKDVKDMLNTIKLNSLDELFKIIPDKFKSDYKDLDEQHIKDSQSLNYKVVSRKKVVMDYLSNSDTLTIDSLYSSVNHFKKGYNQKDLFDIKITRFKDAVYFIDLNEYGFDKDEDKDCSVLLANEDFLLDQVTFLLPFISEPVHSDIYYKKMENPNIVISSPVPKNENWSYWQKINVISIKNMGNSQYSKKSISIPTPFSFYTGDHGKIENGNKSWID